MKVRALRGVCIGVDRHLRPGDTVDLPAAEVTFLASIGAVERVLEPPPIAERAIEPDLKPEPPAKVGTKEK